MEARALSTAAFVAGLLMATPSLAANKVFDRSFEVPSSGRLSMALDLGRISIVGSDTSRVVVRLRAEGSEQQIGRVTWSAEKDAAGVSVTVKHADGNPGWFVWRPQLRVSAEIEVPRAYDATLTTSDGQIEVRGLNGNVTGKTSGGRIQVESVQGNVQMRTSGGAVMLRSLGGDVEVHTSGGPIQATQLTRGLRGHTSGGAIRLEQVSGPIDVHTSGGSIEIDLVGENQGVVARTSGGSISLRVPSSINGSLNASTSGGRVTSDLTMTRSESSGSHLRGLINSGGPEILARSSGGSVQIMRKD